MNVARGRKRCQVPIGPFTDDSIQQLFAYARYIAVENRDIRLLLDGKFDPIKIPPIGINNEFDALYIISDAAAVALAQFNNSLEADEQLLASGTLTSNLRNCVLMRRGEKIVLHHYARMATVIGPLLTLTWPRLKQRLPKFREEYPAYRDYLHRSIEPMVAFASQQELRRLAWVEINSCPLSEHSGWPAPHELLAACPTLEWPLAGPSETATWKLGTGKI